MKKLDKAVSESYFPHELENVGDPKKKKKNMSCRGRVYVVLGTLFSYFFPEASLMSCSGQVVPSIQVIILSEGPQGRLQN